MPIIVNVLHGSSGGCLLNFKDGKPVIASINGVYGLTTGCITGKLSVSVSRSLSAEYHPAFYAPDTYVASASSASGSMVIRWLNPDPDPDSPNFQNDYYAINIFSTGSTSMYASSGTVWIHSNPIEDEIWWNTFSGTSTSGDIYKHCTGERDFKHASGVTQESISPLGSNSISGNEILWDQGSTSNTFGNDLFNNSDQVFAALYSEAQNYFSNKVCYDENVTWFDTSPRATWFSVSSTTTASSYTGLISWNSSHTGMTLQGNLSSSFYGGADVYGRYYERLYRYYSLTPNGRGTSYDPELDQPILVSKLQKHLLAGYGLDYIYQPDGTSKWFANGYDTSMYFGANWTISTHNTTNDTTSSGVSYFATGSSLTPSGGDYEVNEGSSTMTLSSPDGGAAGSCSLIVSPSNSSQVVFEDIPRGGTSYIPFLPNNISQYAYSVALTNYYYTDVLVDVTWYWTYSEQSSDAWYEISTTSDFRIPAAVDDSGTTRSTTLSRSTIMDFITQEDPDVNGSGKYSGNVVALGGVRLEITNIRLAND